MLGCPYPRWYTTDAESVLKSRVVSCTATHPLFPSTSFPTSSLVRGCHTALSRVENRKLVKIILHERGMLSRRMNPRFPVSWNSNLFDRTNHYIKKQQPTLFKQRIKCYIRKRPSYRSKSYPRQRFSNHRFAHYVKISHDFSD